MQQHIQNLLADVGFQLGTLREAKKRFSHRLAPDFRIFDFLRTDENGLSTCIAHLLDPNGKHGQGPVFLKAFLEIVGVTDSWLEKNSACQVLTEKRANGLRRIDIYLDLGAAGIIGIENKPWAGDQDLQLADYAAYLKTSAGARNWLLVYLSNREPSETSIKPEKLTELRAAETFVRVGFDEIVDWLEACVCRANALVVQVFVEELIKFIDSNINGKLDMSEDEETREEILKTGQSLVAAFEVSKAMKGVKEKLLNTFHSDLATLLARRGFQLIWENGLENKWQGNMGFGVKFDSAHRFFLRFEFEYTDLTGLFWGVAREDASVERDASQWDAIYKVMDENFGRTWGQNNVWPWYSRIADAGIGSQLENWSLSSTPWVMIAQGESGLASKICELTDRVHDAFKSEPHLLTKLA